VKALSVWKDSEIDFQKSIDQLKKNFGEEQFPWENWIEFRKAMEEIKDEWNYDAYEKAMFKPGACEIGCQIPIFVLTFSFNQGKGCNNDDFHWSCSNTIV
jgi:hypothetical protein